MKSFFDDSEANVRSARYLIARTVCDCRHCGRSTTLVALCLPPGHAVFEIDDDAPVEVNDGVWTEVAVNAMLFHVCNLSDAVRRRLNEFAPRYDLAAGEAPGSHWANHCEGCARQLDDNELFCEPDGAFLPTSEARARLIHLSTIEESIEASAAGYALEPQFFDAMRRD